MPARPWEHARVSVQCYASVMYPTAEFVTDRQLKCAYREDKVDPRKP